ncbi:MAG: tetratricopeptide repeat protein, partial [Planctomycetota bacterium]
MTRARRIMLVRAAGITLCGLAAQLVAGCDDASPREVYVPRAAGTVTFNDQIAPIVHEHCSVCHRPGESGPFDLLTYRDAKRRARQIADIVEDRFMPPWLPEPGYGEFADERRLSVDEIGLIRQWVRDGMPEGDPARTPIPPTFPQGWQLGEPDLVVTMTEPYTLPAEGVPAEGADVFRNFVIPAPVDQQRYVRAIEFRPGNPRVVHHANFMVDRTRDSRRRDGLDPGPGFDGMEPGKATFPDGHILGWTPGKVPSAGMEGLAWRLEAGSDLVLQLHMLPSGRPETLQSSIGLHFADGPPTRHSMTIRLGPRIIDLPAGERDYVIEDEYLLPVDVEVVSIYPHAHYLCREMIGDAELPDGTTRWLVRIDEWDFNWQDEYRCAEPVFLPAGSRLRMRYVYDNSAENPLNPNHPPQRVVYGPRSTDEMGELWIQVMPRDAAALTTLSRDFSAKELRTSITALESMLRLEPDDPSLQVDLGLSYLQAGRTADGVARLQAALRADPDYAPGHVNLGTVLNGQGRTDEAIRHFRRAIALDPTSVEAHHNLGAILLQRREVEEAMLLLAEAVRLDPDHAPSRQQLGNALLAAGRVDDGIGHLRHAVRLDPGLANAQYNLAVALRGRGTPDEIIAHLRRAAEANPQFVEAHYNLALALSRQGRYDDAIAHLRRAVELRPTYAEAHANLGQMLRATGRVDEALVELREAVRLKPRGAASLAGLAWILATHPDAGTRDGPRAVSLATQAAELTRHQDPMVLDALAAAYAETGEYQRAASIAQTALPLARRPALADGIASRLQAYRQGRP